MAKKKLAKRKVEIVFDPQKRKEFLTGFRKRKNERRKKAKDALERSLKEERKRIRQEIKDGVQHMKKSFEPLKELTEADKANEDEYEDDDVKVKIVELSTADLAAQRNLLGVNRAEDSEENVDEEPSTDEEASTTNCIPGMDFDVNAKRKRKLSGGNEDSSKENQKSKQSKTNKQNTELKSKKELDHFKKTKTLKKLKKSKAFKMKEQLDKIANQKKTRKDNNNTMKSLPKHMRKKKKFQKNPYSKGRLLNKKQLRQKNSS